MTLDEWTSLSPQQQRRQFYLELMAYWKEQCLKGKTVKVEWVAQKYRARFGRYPPDGAERLAPAPEVSPHVRDWVRGQQIAWAKERRRRGSPGSSHTMERQSAGTASTATTKPAGDA